jgi:hypothetical protein
VSGFKLDVMKKVLVLLFLTLLVAPAACQMPGGSPPPVSFSEEELQRRTFHYFWDLADSTYGQIPDRWPSLTFSSIAATGFGLTAYIVGAEKGFVTRVAAAQRTLKTLNALWELPQGPDASGVSGYQGFFYHFLNLDDARRFKQVELSTIDTGLLLAGILSAQSYYDQDNKTENDIRAVADAIYRRVNWPWFLNKNGLLSMGWHPESGFLDAQWDGYNEAMILYVLAYGSPTHPISPDSWNGWTKPYLWTTFQDQEMLNFAPLFGHQYSHMYIDFRGIQDAYMRDKGIDYFENSRRATLANRAYCISNPLGFKDYSDKVWGLTACDGPRDTIMDWKGNRVQFQEYSARGAAADYIRDDGTIAPTAAGGSVPFTPEESLTAMKYMWETYYENLIGEYGFKDAFNPSYTKGIGNEQGWFDKDYLGIDQGPILIQLENYRSEIIWKLMKKNLYIVDGLTKAGFTGAWLEVTSKNK